MNDKRATAATALVGDTQPRRELPLLDVTNFAINCGFMESARSANDPEELKKSLSSDHFYGCCALDDDSRPALERPGFVSEAIYRQEYWQRVYAMLPVLDTALHIVRDILWFHQIRYDPLSYRFQSSPSQSSPSPLDRLPMQFGPTFMIFEAIFDYPDLKPFRYAQCIISQVMARYSAVERKADYGELAYSIRFKVIKESGVQDRTINLRRYVANV